jgi:aspartate/methionine/tyrosine aminotransferase
MKSLRLPADLTVNATTRTLAALRARGIAILDLTVSNPTHVGLHYPQDLFSPLASADALSYEPDPLGLRSAREAVAADYARRGLSVSPDRIALTASTSEAYAWLFKLLCDPGDDVLIPQPGYPLFEHLTVLESILARPYRLEYHGAWRVDVSDVEHALTDRTKAILVVSPNNPTGSLLHRDDLAALDEVCAARNLMLIGDEVFADYVLDPAPDAASVLEAECAVSCTLGGLSKSAGLPQVKLGWIAMGGATTHLAALFEAYEVIADTYLSVSTPVQVAAPQLIARGADIRRQIQERTRRNLAALRRAAAAVAAVSVLRVEGGWSAVLQIPRYRSEESLILELLTADHVLVHPGYFFDFEREAFLVVSLLVEPATFDEGVRRLLARVDNRSGQV